MQTKKIQEIVDRLLEDFHQKNPEVGDAIAEAVFYGYPIKYQVQWDEDKQEVKCEVIKDEEP